MMPRKRRGPSPLEGPADGVEIGVGDAFRVPFGQGVLDEHDHVGSLTAHDATKETDRGDEGTIIARREGERHGDNSTRTRHGT